MEKRTLMPESAKHAEKGSPEEPCRPEALKGAATQLLQKKRGGVSPRRPCLFASLRGARPYLSSAPISGSERAFSEKSSVRVDPLAASIAGLDDCSVKSAP